MHGGRQGDVVNAPAAPDNRRLVTLLVGALVVLYAVAIVGILVLN